MSKVLILILSLGLFTGSVLAEETVGESVSNTAKSASAALKKGANRVKEVVCTEGDLKCAAQKGKHRLGEGGTSIKNKGSEVKDKVD